MRQARLQMTLALATIVALSFGGPAPAAAQEGWSWIVTPQIWTPHIEKNGFTSAGSLGGFVVVNPGGVAQANPFPGVDSKPVDDIDPQWGIQIAAQKGRLTLAGSFQYVEFETRSDIVFDFTGPVGTPFGLLFPDDRIGQEFIDTTRIDFDLAASYLFPDVIQNRLDLSLGVGVKFIYAEAIRQVANLSTIGQFLAFLNGGPYFVCRDDALTDCGFKDRVKVDDYLYGATLPMSAIVHLTSDSRWLLPLSISPFLGAETRDDRDVVYRLDTTSATTVEADRLDGTTFAYGVTADATVRYLLNDAVSLYGGMRVQYIKGHEEYLAYGPLVGMSVRFGGK